MPEVPNEETDIFVQPITSFSEVSLVDAPPVITSVRAEYDMTD